MYSIQLLKARGTTGSDPEYDRPGSTWNYQARLTGTGAISATVLVEVSNGAGWKTFGTMTMSGNNEVVDNVSGNMPWAKHRAT